ncbi:hypothetical protein QL285_041710 [Trifolium repens]|nr:hypothetical protein QL285_041710 [Trifolium repens]
MATGNPSQRHNDDGDYPFHDADGNPMSTIFAPTNEIVPQDQQGTGATVTVTAGETDLRDGRPASPSSGDDSIEIVRPTPASAAGKATASGEKAPAANKPPKRQRQILMPMATEEGFRTLITAI